MDKESIIKLWSQIDQKDQEEKEKRVIEYWNNLKELKEPYDIPSLPNPMTEFYTNKLIECGAIAKIKLEDNQKYLGECRNATEAVWHADKEKFTYIRHKWGGSFEEDINHFEDDDGFDLFVPIKKL